MVKKIDMGKGTPSKWGARRGTSGYFMEKTSEIDQMDGGEGYDYHESSPGEEEEKMKFKVYIEGYPRNWNVMNFDNEKRARAYYNFLKLNNESTRLEEKEKLYMTDKQQSVGGKAGIISPILEKMWQGSELNVRDKAIVRDHGIIYIPPHMKDGRMTRPELMEMPIKRVLPMNKKEINEARRVGISDEIIGKFIQGIEPTGTEKKQIRWHGKAYVEAHKKDGRWVKPQLRNLSTKRKLTWLERTMMPKEDIILHERERYNV